MGAIQGLDKFKFDVGGGSNIKSIQRGVATITTGQDLSITISSVDITKSIVLINSRGTYNDNTTNFVYGKLLNSTTLYLARGFNGAVTTNISYQVIELQNIKSMQKGTSIIDVSQSNIAVTIGSITLDKVILFTSFYVNNLNYGISVDISNSTTITFTRSPSGASSAYNGAVQVQWFLVESN